MDIEQFRKAGRQAIDRICDYRSSLEERPVASQVQPGFLRFSVPPCPPEKEEDFQDIADDYQNLILPGLSHWQHPSFFAYFPAACTFESTLAELYASSVGNPGLNWSSGPACIELEVVVVDWAAQLLSLSAVFSIHLGSETTTLVSVIAARSDYQRKHPEVKAEELVIYVTTQTHSLGIKPGLVLGLRVRAIEVWPNDRYALRGEGLRAALEEDEEAGLKPFILIANVGTTSSGAIDNIPEIATILRDHPEVWVHIDAAWGGMALCCPEYWSMCHLDEINAIATSFCTNFHKWGLVNFEASALWVRDRKFLTDALSVAPPLLGETPGDCRDVIDYRNWESGPERHFRSLKLWFVMRSFGVEGFQDYIRRTIRLNERFANLVRQSDSLELVTEPSLALSLFRLRLGFASTTVDLNELTSTFYSRTAARQDIMYTQTMLNGITCIRLVVGAYRTEGKHVDRAFQLLQDEGHVIIKEWKQAQRES